MVPAYILEASNNVLVISAHYTEFTAIQVSWTFSIFPVYASMKEERKAMKKW